MSFDDPLAGTAVSPFKDVSFDYFYLEDFEDSSFNVPGVTISEFIDIGTPNFADSDSVDGDDGQIDGTSDGVSLFSDFDDKGSFTFNFSASQLGALPTHAGIVWTDVGRNNGGTPFANDIVDNVVFEAFGPAGELLYTEGPFSLGDSSIFGTTDEDRFFGAINLDGLTAIKISMPGLNNWEVDHLQYGLVSPFPLPGNFDNDNDVDGKDFLAWQRDDGMKVGLAHWKQNYGTGAIGISIESIPEPSSIFLAVLGIFFWDAPTEEHGQALQDTDKTVYKVLLVNELLRARIKLSPQVLRTYLNTIHEEVCKDLASNHLSDAPLASDWQSSKTPAHSTTDSPHSC